MSCDDQNLVQIIEKFFEDEAMLTFSRPPQTAQVAESSPSLLTWFFRGGHNSQAFTF